MLNSSAEITLTTAESVSLSQDAELAEDQNFEATSADTPFVTGDETVLDSSAEITPTSAESIPLSHHDPELEDKRNFEPTYEPRASISRRWRKKRKKNSSYRIGRFNAKANRLTWASKRVGQKIADANEKADDINSNVAVAEWLSWLFLAAKTIGLFFEEVI